jgi:hypothetical protein
MLMLYLKRSKTRKMSYTHLNELLETLDILNDTEFVTNLRPSINQARQGETISWENAKAKLGL